MVGSLKEERLAAAGLGSVRSGEEAVDLLCHRGSHDLLQFLDGSVAQLLDRWKLLQQKWSLDFANPGDLLHSLNKGRLGERTPLLPEERVPAGLPGLLLNQLVNEAGCFQLAGHREQHHPKVEHSKLLDFRKVLFTYLCFFNYYDPLKMSRVSDTNKSLSVAMSGHQIRFRDIENAISAGEVKICQCQTLLKHEFNFSLHLLSQPGPAPLLVSHNMPQRYVHRACTRVGGPFHPRFVW